ncbi:hypothetical protein ANCCEY_06392, partial [Ancylostoma ceylanicum]
LLQLSAQFNDDLKTALSGNSALEERVRELSQNHRKEREKCEKQLQDVNNICSMLESDIKKLTTKYQMREELIELKSARQHEQNELRDEVALLREQIGEERNAKLAMERDLLAQVNHLQTQLGIAASKVSTFCATLYQPLTHG